MEGLSPDYNVSVLQEGVLAMGVLVLVVLVLGIQVTHHFLSYF